MKIETIAIHAGHRYDPQTGAVMSPIHLSTTYLQGNDDNLIYGRTNNPNRHELEACLTALEGGAETVAFASGMAAVAAVFQSLSPGDHVIIADDTYYGARFYVTDMMARWGLTHDLVDLTDLDQVRGAIRPNTRLIWAETPSNPMLKITDIAAVAAIAHAHGALLAVDGTWATPMLQPFLAQGADIVVHSTTKYLGGHSDLTGGAVVFDTGESLYERIREQQNLGGGVPSGFDSWLLLRGIRTLPYRMRAHCENARAVAAFLAAHPAVHTVHYPGLPTHPGHAIAQRQMRDFGGMMSIQVHSGRERAAAVAAATQLFARATSLGGVESLIEHRAPVEGPTTNTPYDLLRLSIGLEHPDDLIADLEQALASR